MAVKTVVTGGAHASETGGINGKAGDQKQDTSATADYTGEVSLQSYDESAFKSGYSGYVIYRPIKPDDASAIANIMIKACNNPNIGYSQDTRGGIFTHGADSTVPINCDCSSLVSYCISQGIGISINTTTSYLGEAMDKSGKFMSGFPVSQISFATNPPYNGDVILKAGSHVEMVVQGSPREGKEDEIVTGTWAGNGNEIIQYRTSYGQTYDFAARNTQPSPSEEYYGMYLQNYGVTSNGSYAWGRFSELMKSACDLCRDQPRRWYVYNEDGYSRGMAPSVGAVMCFTNKFDTADPGIVCIVERVEQNCIYVSQRSPKTGVFEYIKKVKRNGSWDMDLNGDGKYEYVFQGFIYNPAVNTGAEAASAVATFTELAKAQVGSSGLYTEKYTGLNTVSAAWAAAFIVAVANQAGSILNIVIPNTYSCSDIGRIGIIRGMGTWFDGAALGGNPCPQVGDIALFRTTKAFDRANKYSADKAGIVVEVSGSSNASVSGTNQNASYTFKVVMGDCSGVVALKSYNTTSATFSGLFRPQWSRIDGTSQSVLEYRTIEGLYTEGTCVEDAAIRDLRYVNLAESGFEPSIKSSGTLLCAINYTGMLANMYTTFAEVGSSSATDANLVVDLWTNTVQSMYQETKDNQAAIVSASSYTAVDTSDMDTAGIAVGSGGSVTMSASYYGATRTRSLTLNNTIKTIYNLLNKQIQNPAGTIGIMGNMYQECGFDCSAVNAKDGGSGLIQWTNTSSKWGESKRADEMKEYCKTHGDRTSWKTNVAGQIEFLFYEVSTVNMYKTGMDYIKRVSKDLAGAKEAARLFLDYFEIGGPQHRGETLEVENYNLRSTWAAGIWQLFFGGKDK